MTSAFDAALKRLDRAVLKTYRTEARADPAGSAKDLIVVFDREHLEIDLNGSSVMADSAVGPAASCRFADLPAGFGQDSVLRVFEPDDTEKTGGTDYTVQDMQPDGRGWVVMPLHEV